MQVTRAPRVLITRPQGQHIDFASQCTALGFQVQLLPCINIVPLKLNTARLKTQLTDYNSVLLTSTNAVHCSHTCLPFPWSGINVHAIGEATARTLEGFGQSVALRPAPPFNSEAYLAQLACRAAENLLIIKGAGGRGLIQTHLRELGWHVESLNVYERVMPTLPEATVDEIFNRFLPDIVSVTSNEILENLWHLCAAYRDILTTRQLVCNSERCAQLAHSLGFSSEPLIARPAGDNGQMACLSQWKRLQQGFI